MSDEIPSATRKGNVSLKDLEAAAMVCSVSMSFLFTVFEAMKRSLDKVEDVERATPKDTASCSWETYIAAFN